MFVEYPRLEPVPAHRICATNIADYGPANFVLFCEAVCSRVSHTDSSSSFPFPSQGHNLICDDYALDNTRNFALSLCPRSALSIVDKTLRFRVMVAVGR
jgi:hypothetical protein